MSLKILFTLCILSAAVSVSIAQDPFGTMKIPVKHQQIVLVTAEAWNSPTGTLQMYNKTNSTWIPIGKKISVVLGKNGMGWGRGLHLSIPTGLIKKEGDGKAPAGIFEFGNAFGYQNTKPVGIKIPYRPCTERDYWVDAINSPEYNTWVTIPKDKENNPATYWSSFERMKRKDHLYELGIVVKHNMEPAIASKGSAIFFHIWRMAGSPTLGCTAMSKQDLETLLAWMDPDKSPLLIQLPMGEMKTLIYDNN